jgi:pyruvyltransferase
MRKSSSEVLKLDTRMKHLVVALLKPFANSFILLNPKCKAKKNRVNLNYWDDKPNLGDAISPIVVEYLLKQKNLSLDMSVQKTKHLYAIGSVISAGIQDCTVWGSGVLYTTLGYRIKDRDLDIRSVRGPMTRMLLMEYGYVVPEIYGDPAIFMPEIYKPSNVQKSYKYGIVDHKNGSKHLNDLSGLDGNYILIDIKTRDYKKFIDDLVSVEYVISTSLHGIILAESYGIPAILVQPDFSLFKYYDWYCGTGRSQFAIHKNLKDIKVLDFMEVPDLTEIRENVRNAFPYDLFMN